MNASLATTDLSLISPTLPARRKEQFRQRFQRSLRACLRRGFSIEESFGMIWVETWEEVSVTDREQSELYDELIDWAKRETASRRY